MTRPARSTLSPAVMWPVVETGIIALIASHAIGSALADTFNPLAWPPLLACGIAFGVLPLALFGVAVVKGIIR